MLRLRDVRRDAHTIRIAIAPGGSHATHPGRYRTPTNPGYWAHPGQPIRKPQISVTSPGFKPEYDQSRESQKSRKHRVQIGAYHPPFGGLGWHSVAAGAPPHRTATPPAWPARPRREGCSVAAPYLVAGGRIDVCAVRPDGKQAPRTNTIRRRPIRRRRYFAASPVSDPADRCAAFHVRANAYEMALPRT